jgi:hypothetical protein
MPTGGLEYRSRAGLRLGEGGLGFGESRSKLTVDARGRFRASERPSPLLGLIAIAPAFFGYATYVLNNFYRYGATLIDAGLLAGLAWRSSPSLPEGPVYRGVSFYAYHVSPLMTLLSALSWLVPLSTAQWFALFTGFAQSLLAAAVFWLLWADYDLRRGWRAAAAVGLSILFSFNGLALAQVRYPHFEIMLAASLILFLVAWHRRQWILAGVFFALCLICREDAGFHVVAILAVVTALNRLNGIALREQKPALTFMAIGFAYSVGALVAGHLLFPQQSSFMRVYAGDPPFAHLTSGVLSMRLRGLLVYRAYLSLPAVCAVIWAILARNPYIAAGYIAFIPWAALNLVAKSDLAGTLSSYYAFPFLVAMVWPMIGWCMKPPPMGTPAWVPYLGFAAMILASFTALSFQHNPNGEPLWPGLVAPPSLAMQAKTDRALEAIAADGGRLGRLVASDSVVALRPASFRHDETFLDPNPSPANTVVYFAGERSSSAGLAAAAASRLQRTYVVIGTPLRVATDVDGSALPRLGPLLTLAEPPGR